MPFCLNRYQVAAQFFLDVIDPLLLLVFNVRCLLVLPLDILYLLVYNLLVFDHIYVFRDPPDHFETLEYIDDVVNASPFDT